MVGIRLTCAYQQGGRFLVAAGQVQNHRARRSNDRRQRIHAISDLGGGHGLVLSSLAHQILAVPVMHDRERRIEIRCPSEVLIEPFPIPIVQAHVRE